MLSDRAPTPPRAIGQSTWMSRIGSSPKRRGMRVFTRSRSARRPSPGRPPATKWKSLPGVGAGQVRHLAAVDPVRVGDDPAGGRLAEDLGQPHHRHRAGADQVGQHLARPDRGQLIDVAHHQQGGRRRGAPAVSACISGTSTMEASSMTSRSHSERVIGSAPEAAGAGIDLQQAMDRPGLEPGRLAQPLRRPPGGGREQDAHRLGGEDGEDRAA